MGRIPSHTAVAMEEVMIHSLQRTWRNESLVNEAAAFIRYKREEGFSFSALTYLHSEMFFNPTELTSLHSSAAVEVLILALDIFDDLQDQDTRDKPWTQSPYASTMNIATGLLMLSMNILHKAPVEENIKERSLSLLHQQVLKAVQGQHQDLAADVQSEDGYLQMVKEKSGSLMACASLLGAVSATKKQFEIIKRYSEYLGIAAQLNNDLHDVLRVDEKNDLLHKKKTLPILYLLQEKEPQAQWIRDYYRGTITKEMLLEKKNQLFQWLENSSSLKYTKVVKRLYQLKAVQLADDLEAENEWKAKLRSVLEDT
ncbi:polyprenyl synthetase family protein [Halobacillus salinarum]|uniref:Polyprenyl synthetase family protein n=1 Tax=Halobacillus salinarum TaxID=2932257 RepID=A0ABY4EIY6_9BACI|nr:polyprenyl synthetase family protein [Halobacillus salinarum]UOQ43925.1 polyprenyl synthetase family protein [Halobacillus salinarum]